MTTATQPQQQHDRQVRLSVGDAVKLTTGDLSKPGGDSCWPVDTECVVS